MCNIDVFKGECPDALLDCVCMLFNVCNNNGLPTPWKTALLMPLYKKGDANVCGNYRGISPLEPLSKWYTKCVLHRLDKAVDHLGLRAKE